MKHRHARVLLPLMFIAHDPQIPGGEGGGVQGYGRGTWVGGEGGADLQR